MARVDGDPSKGAALYHGAVDDAAIVKLVEVLTRKQTSAQRPAMAKQKQSTAEHCRGGFSLFGRTRGGLMLLTLQADFAVSRHTSKVDAASLDLGHFVAHRKAAKLNLKL